MPDKNSSRSIKFKLIISALLLMTIALGFNALLSFNSLEKLYVDSMVSKYNVIGKDLQRTIERALKFGKEINSFYGIESALDKTKQDLINQIANEDNDQLITTWSSDISVSIAMLDDQSTLYTTETNIKNTKLPAEVFVKNSNGDTGTKDEKTDLSYVKLQENYFLFIPIKEGSGNKNIAAIIIKFTEKPIKVLLNSIFQQNIWLIATILLAGFVLLIISLNSIKLDSNIEKKFPKARISFILFCLIVMTQIVFTGLNTYKFKKYYLKINKEKTTLVLNMLKEDIEYFLKKGLPLIKLKKMDAMLGKIILSTPELDNIVIVDNSGWPLYRADNSTSIDFQENIPESDFELEKPVLDLTFGYALEILKKGKEEGAILATLSKKVLNDKLKAILIDSATVLVISLLFFIEAMVLLFQYILRQVANGQKKKHRQMHYVAIRPVAFLFLFGIDASISFIPLHMENLYEPIFGISKDIVMGLPISVKVFFAAIFVFIGGIWVDKRGWYEPLLTGLCFACAGLIYAWAVPDAINFIASMGIVGIGFGLTIMAAQGFVISNIDKDKRSQGIALLFAGAYAGSICGGATGAMLAERLGFTPIFLFSAVIILGTLIYVIMTMNDSYKPSEQLLSRQSKSLETQQNIQFKQIIKFIFDKNVLSLVALCSLPAAMAIIGFMNYLCPIYLNRIGTSQSTIGRVFMIYGLCMIYLAPYIGKFVDKSGNSKKYIFFSGLLGGFAFIIYQTLGNVAAVALTILLLGLSASCGSAPRRSYVLKLQVAQELGSGKSMGVFNSMTRIGQVIGPIIFGWLMLRFGINTGLTFFGIAYLIAAVLFYFIAREDRKTIEV